MNRIFKSWSIEAGSPTFLSSSMSCDGERMGIVWGFGEGLRFFWTGLQDWQDEQDF